VEHFCQQKRTKVLVAYLGLWVLETSKLNA